MDGLSATGSMYAANNYPTATPSAFADNVDIEDNETMPTPQTRSANLVALSRQTDFSVGCYCEDEARCHRSVLREELAARGAKVG